MLVSGGEIAATFKRRPTHDIEEHAAGLAGWQMQYDQMSPGRFRGSLTQFWLDGLQVVRDESNLAMVKRGCVWRDGPDATVFSLPQQANVDDFYLGGRAINGDYLLVTQGRCLPELRTTSSLDVVSIAVDTSLVRKMLVDQSRGMEISTDPLCFRLARSSALAEFKALTNSVMRYSVTSDGSSLSRPEVSKNISEMMLMLLLDLANREEPERLQPHARRRVVDRACDYVLASGERPPSVVEVCNAVGASRRKLQYCFQEALGINPLTYLRSLRLNAVHRELLRCGGRESETVHDVAWKWGFWHLGRFAGEYRQLFGELPSETLRRARSDSLPDPGNP
ncbi:helix-turn-helix domain-containing protein [Modicisalibacter coralii]|uniref:helix-turn-helix domain-containing protein n=1 Tax=Modicisalibacter coralii TaxID=2304602 RepID=UPI00100AFA97|nr:helix-turn-helix domain-containing protein [Halomonas coralii]